METITIPVRGLNENDVTKALKRTRGVLGVDIDLAENLATVTFDDGETSQQTVETVVDECRHRM